MQQPTLFLMLGYPGSGKTTVSSMLHELTGAVHVWADHERRERFGEPTYSHEETVKLYNSLNDKTATLLQQGKSVIYDTNFNFYKDRERLRHIAHEHGARAVVVWVKTPKDIARNRAVHEAHKHPTRILGEMPLHYFERISNNLQSPRPDEQVIALTGVDVTKETVTQALNTYEASA